MEDYELTLFDRLNVIKDVIAKYGEGNFYIAFSGGKDSMVLHHLIDEALPGNRIPRVYVNTGIEYNMMVAFVQSLAEKDDRITIIRPKIPIKKMLEEKGYPFKSKQHSDFLKAYRNAKAKGKTIPEYLQEYFYRRDIPRQCPDILLYQLEDDSLKISDSCCEEMKEKPMKRYGEESGRKIAIIGIRKEEGGRRRFQQGCLSFRGGELNRFKPLHPVSEGFEEWYIKERGITLCGLYYPPYRFTRTGCKGCPFAPDLEKELETIGKFFPKERKQCEVIWKPVYEEYRRIGYRIKKYEQLKLDI